MQSLIEMIEKSSEKHPLSLCLYPNSYGIAFVLSNGPKDIIDFGIKKITPLKTRSFLKQTQWLLEYAKPNVVVIRNPESNRYQWSKQKEQMIDKLKALAQSQDLTVFEYNRAQIKEVFTQFGSTNKFAIARRLVSWYPFLKSKMPSFRKQYLAEHYQMGLFDAFALVITHNYLQD